MKKLLALTLSLLMVISMVAVSFIATASAPIGTTYEYSFNQDKGGLTLSSSTMPTADASYDANGGYYYDFNGVEAGQSAIFTSAKPIEPGKYKVTFYTRSNSSGRAILDITLNDYQAVEVDPNTAYEVYKEYLLYESIDFYGDFTVRLDAKSAGRVFAGYLAFEKIGEYEGEEITTVAVPVVDSNVYKWNLGEDNFTPVAGWTMNDATNKGTFFSPQYQSEDCYFVSNSNAIGNTVTLVSKVAVVPGTYSARLYARTTGDRASVDLLINGVKVASNLNTKVDGASSTNGGYDYPFDLTENTITITEPSQIEFTITTTTSGNLYFNSLELTKVTDDGEEEESSSTTTVPVPVEQDGETTDLISTDDGASIRLNEVNGMRFYATVNGDISNATEMGIIIAPKDLVQGEFFTMEDDHIKVPYNFKENALWDGNQIVGSIVNLKSSNAYNEATGNLARDYIARAYVVIDGVTYYANETAVRSLAYVADAYIADTNAETPFDALDADTKALVEKWAAAND